MANDRLYELLLRFTAGTATAADRDELDTLLADRRNEPDVHAILEKSWDDLRDLVVLDKGVADQLFSRVVGAKPEAAPTRTKLLSPRTWLAAASILLLLGLGVWLYQLTRPTPTNPSTAVAQSTDLPPGGNKAILTLANGQHVILDSARLGTLAAQNGSTVTKTDSGRLAYTTSRTPPAGSVAYNTLTTPKGGQYQLTLADGTRVWLNAASSITYPTAFSGNTRTVTITGEAYLEVAQDPGKPFTVHAQHTDIRVLGTSFNINAYPDEPALRTTLLDGAVNIVANRAMQKLAPGQQAIVSPGSQTINLEPHPDLDAVMAWKNGRFFFHDADLPTIMRQVARWYDVEIVYAGPVPAGHYNGRPSRSLTATQMLKIIEYSGVKYRIEGKKIIIE